MFLKVIIWMSLIFLLWTYVIYPFLIHFLSVIFARPWKEGKYEGRVSLIIAAHNEEDVIREKVKNCLDLDFGNAEYEILIVSDGSTDSTNKILSEYHNSSERLNIVMYQPRAGKANALNVGVAKATGDVLIFSDANVKIDKTACCHLLAPFADNEVGAVSGKVLVKARGSDEVSGESMYMKYESWVQRAESKFLTMVGVDGALFGIRRELFTPLALNTVLDDFTLSMEAPLSKKRIVYAEKALAEEEVVASAANEFKRKARIVAGGYQYLADLFKNSRTLSVGVWFELISHKIMKWFAPFLLLFLLAANFFLLDILLYRYLFAAQLLFYLLALIGSAIKKTRKIYFVYVPYYFCVVNFAALLGFQRFFSGNQHILWDKVER